MLERVPLRDTDFKPIHPRNVNWMYRLEFEQLSEIVDTRDQTPWILEPMRTVRAGLDIGDYSILGLESVIAIERKSLADFVACCGAERERFQRELDRLRGWPVTAVVVEAGWGDFEQANWQSELSAKQVQASFVAWIAQGHRLILGRDAETSALIGRGVRFYAARYRLREATCLLANVTDKNHFDECTDPTSNISGEKIK